MIFAHRASSPNSIRQTQQTRHIHWFFELLILPLSFALTLGPCLAQTNGSALRGSNPVTILVEELNKDSIACDISEGLIYRTIKYPFSAAKFTLVNLRSKVDAVVFYVNVATLYLDESDYCVSNISVSAEYDQTTQLEFSGRGVFSKLILWEKGKLIGSGRSHHEQQISQAIEAYAKEFVADWNLDNKAIELPEGFSAGPAPKIPDGLTAGPTGATKRPPEDRPSPASKRAAPSQAANPFADLIPKKFDTGTAKADATNPDAGTSAEVVRVKYRGPVSLAPFKCDAVTRSSFIERVCYDAANLYMLIDLTGAWYHYCEIDAGTVSNLMAADSMGRFYDQSIKGRFDCRTLRVPHY
jgi:KTSC domain